MRSTGVGTVYMNVKCGYYRLKWAEVLECENMSVDVSKDVLVER